VTGEAFEGADNEIRRLVAVYDAVGTLRGELAYVLRARIGSAHCALCDITHGVIRERADWQTQRAALGVPVDTFHRDDQPSEVRELTGGVAPVVVAQTLRTAAVLLDRHAIERCNGSPARLSEAIRAEAARLELRWPGAPGP